MFKRLRVKESIKSNQTNISIAQLIGDASLPVTIKSINSLPENPKHRLYRILVPIQVLADFDINPRTWKNPDKETQVQLEAIENKNCVKISAWYGEDRSNEFLCLELADNIFNGIDLHFFIANNPLIKKFNVDIDDQGRDTHYGNVYRNIKEEQRAMAAGLAPGQIRKGLQCSQIVINHIETFLTMMAHHAFFLEPMTYVSAWIFEKRGFAYTKGHKFMDTIHKEFMPDGQLFKALDGSTPFRQPDQWKTVRGRAWAIHDGVLDDMLDRKWDDVKMVKQVGRNAGVNTFPNSKY